MRLPFDPKADPVGHDAPYKRIDLWKRRRNYPRIITLAEIREGTAKHPAAGELYDFNWAMDRFELKREHWDA